MLPNLPALTFDSLDSLAFAGERQRFDPQQHRFTASSLGPVFELRLLAKSKVLPWPAPVSWLGFNGIQAMVSALSERRNHQWVCPKTRSLGSYRTYSSFEQEGNTWVEFGIAAQYAATTTAGLPKEIARQLVAAMGEMQSNIYEHSNVPSTGVIAFMATPGEFEFVVSDGGIGILNSLKTCPDYAALSDHGEALKLAIRPGVSRHGSNAGRGRGFQDLFVGLVNLTSTLRFRSGDHALTADGQGSGTTVPLQLAQKAGLSGFLVAVSCKR